MRTLTGIALAGGTCAIAGQGLALHTPPSADRPASICQTCVAKRAALNPAASPAMRGGGLAFSVSIQDPGGQLAGLHGDIQNSVLAAAEDWGAFLVGSGSFEIRVRVTTEIPRAAAGSTTTGFVATRDGFNVFEQGFAYELRTGIDPNGAVHDMEILLNPVYAMDELWFDSDPYGRTGALPSNRTDAVSVMIHELGHCLAYNGWLDATTGSLPGDFRSPTDELTMFAEVPYFEGPRAFARYGNPVPMTFGNWCHWGNNDPLPGSDLILETMNGVVYFRGTRYSVTNLDLDLCEDIGLAVRRPCGQADIGGEGGASGFDQVLDNNDFVVFINAFFSEDARADLGSDGGAAGADGIFDNNDFIVFIQYFFEGCP